MVRGVEDEVEGEYAMMEWGIKREKKIKDVMFINSMEFILVSIYENRKIDMKD